MFVIWTFQDPPDPWRKKRLFCGESEHVEEHSKEILSSHNKKQKVARLLYVIYVIIPFPKTNSKSPWK